MHTEKEKRKKTQLFFDLFVETKKKRKRIIKVKSDELGETLGDSELLA